MKGKFILASMLALSLGILPVGAQRFTDRLDRGLVATVAQSGSGNFVGWKVLAEEYYDVTYNLYCNGSLLKEGLTVSNYVHTAGNANSEYQVAPVVRGVEGEKCAVVKRWKSYSNYGGINTGYLDVMMQPILGRDGSTITSDFAINDISLGDVTGDGVSELIIKMVSSKEWDTSQKISYHHIECYDLQGNRLWWIDLGPNMAGGPDEQFDAVAYDWDEDGKAEVLLRGADNMIIHTSTGHAIEIGDMTKNFGGGEYVNQGAEFLLYLNGSTGEPYDWDGTSDKHIPMDYPLPRYEKGETTDLLGSSAEGSIWGSGIGGHRPTKHYWGAPMLDGRHASIFLGRGCYTRHKFCALDVNPATHELTQRWRLNFYDVTPWFGNGYHNFQIADVDWDGRDEIMFGSMTIDDNGKGLSTTGLGHGDAQHCSDLDPYRHGQEQFACNESQPAMNYRDATTSKIYFRTVSNDDDGRAMCGNFSNQYPGCMGASTQSGVVSCVADKVLPNAPGFDLNSLLYWDGDLLQETLSSPGTERDAKIDKPGVGRIFLSAGCQMNNYTKNNPCAVGDIFGDWREELLLRAENNSRVRIYTSNYPTEFRIPTLWADHQYRNGMVWQMMGYNQPVHASFFLGELEGITTPPPPFTMTGRTEIANGGTISAANNGQQTIVCENGNTSITVSEGADPWVAFFNIPSWVQGTAGNNCTVKETEIIYDYYTCTVSGGAFGGSARLVKQGDGILTLPAVEQKHTGNTDIWAGTLNFDGKMLQSRLWLNRFAELNTNGGQFRSIHMDYDTKLRPGHADTKGTVATDSLLLGFGSRVVFDIYGDLTADAVNATYASIETKNWQYGPKYLTPVFEFVNHGETLADGQYPLGKITKLEGNLSDIVIEGLGNNKKSELKRDDDGSLWLVVTSLRTASYIVWNGQQSNIWDMAGAENFYLSGGDNANNEMFVTGDKVFFGDDAKQFNVSLKGALAADSIIVDASKNYTFSGRGSITEGTLIKRGTGTLTVSTDNAFSGGTRISGGTVNVTTLANEYVANGNLGIVTTKAADFVIENGATLHTTASVRVSSPIQIGEGGATIQNDADFNMVKSFTGQKQKLTKKGSGWLRLSSSNAQLDTLSIAAGTVVCLNAPVPAKVVEFKNGSLNENTGTSYIIYVPKGGKGQQNMVDRAVYSNKVYGEGQLTVYCPVVWGSGWAATRCAIQSNWSQFEGTIVAKAADGDSRFTLDNSYGIPNGTLNVPAGVAVQNTGKTFRIGKLTGAGSLAGFAWLANNMTASPNTWQVGNDQNWTSNVKVTDDANFAKIGTGTITWAAANDNTGTTTVTEGTLSLNSKSLLGTGRLTVGPKGTLAGTTTAANALQNSAITINGVLRPGTFEGATSGLIFFENKNVTINTNGVLEIGARRGATASANGCSALSGINRLTINGTIRIIVNESHTLQVGDSIRLWTANTFVGTPKFDIQQTNMENYVEFDDSRIAEGLLFVKGLANDIEEIHLSDITIQNGIYDMQGRRHENEESLPTGIYIINGKKVAVKKQ